MSLGLHVLNMVVEILETEVNDGTLGSLEVLNGVTVTVGSLEVHMAFRLHVLDVVVEVHEATAAGVGLSVSRSSSAWDSIKVVMSLLDPSWHSWDIGGVNSELHQLQAIYWGVSKIVH